MPTPSALRPRIVVAIASCALAIAAAAAHAAPRFSAPFLAFDAGEGPGSSTGGVHAARVVDLDGDHIPDLVSVNLNSISVLIGVGDGSFGPQTMFATGASPWGLAVGDLNGDGRPDVVTANQGASTVSVFLGDGHGGFGPRTDYATGAGTRDVAIGDVNGDGAPDLVTANASANTISVLPGVGGGAFGGKLDFAAGIAPQAIALGDFNRDGRLDAATANHSTQTLAVMDGAGDFSFAPRRDYGYSASDGAFAIAVGDLNGDGFLDLAMPSGAASVKVSYGYGDGRFSGRYTFGAGASSVSLAIADMNGDGRPDVVSVVGGDFYWSAVRVLVNTGSPAFGATLAAPATFRVPDFSSGVTIGDVDLDGKPDVVEASAWISSLAVMLGNGDGTLGRWRSHPAPAAPSGIAQGDLNGDHVPDIVVYNGQSIGVQLGLVGGGYGSMTAYPTLGAPPGDGAIGDIDLDGRADLVVACPYISTNTLLIYPGNGNGTLRAPLSLPPGGGNGGPKIVDVNRDGRPDVVTRAPQSVYLATGPFTFAAPLTYSNRYAYDSAFGDIDGDGFPDMVTAHYQAGFVSVLMGHGDGTFGPPRMYGSAGQATHVELADLDGDGRLDIEVTTENGTVTELLNDGPLPTGVGPGGDAAVASRLTAAPNPLRIRTALAFELPEARPVSLEVLDVTGRRMRTLANGSIFGIGTHVLHWDGLDETGQRVRDGVYFARFVAGDRHAVQRIVVLR